MTEGRGDAALEATLLAFFIPSKNCACNSVASVIHSFGLEERTNYETSLDSSAAG
jgi:hypothetical protein